MRNSLNCFCWMVILGISFFLLARDGWAAVEIFGPSVLRLETTTSPYSYRVIEKSAREDLRVQDNTSFIIGDEAYPAVEATNVVEDAEGIHGNLIVETAGREQLPDGARPRPSELLLFSGQKRCRSTSPTATHPRATFLSSSMTKASTIMASGSIPLVDTK